MINNQAAVINALRNMSSRAISNGRQNTIHVINKITKNSITPSGLILDAKIIENCKVKLTKNQSIIINIPIKSTTPGPTKTEH